MAPVFLSCPEYMYVRYLSVRDNLPWPTYYDNVGVFNKNKYYIQSKKGFKKAQHFKGYRITDFEGNKATCHVEMKVSNKSGNYFLFNEL